MTQNIGFFLWSKGTNPMGLKERWLDLHFSEDLHSSWISETKHSTLQQTKLTTWICILIIFIYKSTTCSRQIAKMTSAVYLSLNLCSWLYNSAVPTSNPWTQSCGFLINKHQQTLWEKKLEMPLHGFHFVSCSCLTGEHALARQTCGADPTHLHQGLGHVRESS